MTIYTVFVLFLFEKIGISIWNLRKDLRVFLGAFPSWLKPKRTIRVAWPWLGATWALYRPHSAHMCMVDSHATSLQPHGAYKLLGQTQHGFLSEISTSMNPPCCLMHTRTFRRLYKLILGFLRRGLAAMCLQVLLVCNIFGEGRFKGESKGEECGTQGEHQELDGMDLARAHYHHKSTK